MDSDLVCNFRRQLDLRFHHTCTCLRFCSFLVGQTGAAMDSEKKAFRSTGFNP